LVTDPNNSAQLRAPMRKFIFIAGAEGSGTTVLLRFLSAPPGGASLGGNFVKLPNHPESRPLMAAFDLANKQLWDRKLSFAEHAEGWRKWRAALDDILASEAFGNEKRLFFKRSFPFAHPRDRFAPDLWDVLDLQPQAELLVIYRDPRASTYSAFRRGFDNDVRRLAVVCSEQLTWLAAQVAAIGAARFSIVSYRDLCRDPLTTLAPVAARCAIPLDAVKRVVEAEGTVSDADDRWARELPAEEAKWLDDFFDDRRRRQWALLAGEVG
jgi:hypothetical protein